MEPALKKLCCLALTAVLAAVMLGLSGCAGIADKPSKDETLWPKQVKEITYLSSADSTMQPTLFYAPKKKAEAAPLLVALHTWSGNYKQKMSIPYAKWCIKKGWVFIHPHFRGPNWTKQATGSELVVGDIVSAVDYAKSNANVDPSRIYLVGASGGGYTSLLMAGRAPNIWAGVSAWVPITDLRDWYFECTQTGRPYAEHIVKSCGGPPGESAPVDRQYKTRSPITHLHNAVGLPLDINAGIRDGHTGSVPISHSLKAFNLVAAEKDRIAQEHIKYFVEKAEVPPELKGKVADPAYGKKVALFRRSSGRAWVTIFDGGHEIIYEAALTWLSKQKKPSKADPDERGHGQAYRQDHSHCSGPPCSMKLQTSSAAYFSTVLRQTPVPKLASLVSNRGLGQMKIVSTNILCGSRRNDSILTSICTGSLSSLKGGINSRSPPPRTGRLPRWRKSSGCWPSRCSQRYLNAWSWQLYRC